MNLNPFKKKADKNFLKTFISRQLYSLFSEYQPIYQGQDFNSQVEDGYSSNPYVYACVKLIADACATVPIKIGHVVDQKALKGSKYYSQYPNSLDYKSLTKKAMDEIDSHEILDLLYQPNPYQSGSAFTKAFFGFKYITGNSYIEGLKPTTGINAHKIKQMYVLPSQMMEIIAGGRTEPIKGYRMLNSYGKYETLEADKVLHSKLFNPNYDDGQFLYGLSPLQAGGKPLSIANDGFKSRKYTYENMGISGILSDKTGQSLSEDEAKLLKESWQTNEAGLSNHGRVKVTSASLDWLNLGLSPVDMNIIESQRMDKSDIALCYQIPLELLNERDGATFENRKQAAKQFYIKVIVPAFNEYLDELNRWLVPAYNKNSAHQIQLYADWSVIPELQDELKELADRLDTMWWLTPNQKLEMMGEPASTDSNMDLVYINENMIPLDLSGKVKNKQEQDLK